MSSGAAATGMGVPNQVVFTSNATWTCPTGLTQIEVEVVGGGGGGSSLGIDGSSPMCGGGGAGAYTRAIVNVTPGNVYTVTIGSGGAATNPGSAGTASSFTYSTSLTITANPGAGGPNVNGNGLSAPGGAGGTLATCTGAVSLLQSAGGSGGSSGLFTSGGAPGGIGGASYFGAGGLGGTSGTAPTAGQAYGSGGGGGANYAGKNTGGVGASGVVIITYFTQSGVPATYTATAPLSVSGTTLSIANASTSNVGAVQVGSGLNVSSGTVSTYNASYFFYGGLYHSQSTYPSGTSSFTLGDVTDSSDAGGTSPAIYNGFTYPTTTNYPGIDTTNNYINLPAGTWKITITGSAPYAQSAFCAVALYNNTDSKEITRSGWYASAANPNALALIALVQPTSNKQYKIQSINLGTVPQTQANACVMNFIVERLA